MNPDYDYEGAKNFLIGAFVGAVISAPVIIWLVWLIFK